MTNFEKIKQMDLEQMANFLSCISDNSCNYCTLFGNDYCGYNCHNGVKSWLETDVLNLDNYNDYKGRYNG